MGYVENNLLKDEIIIYKTKLHKIIFFGLDLFLYLVFFLLR